MITISLIDFHQFNCKNDWCIYSDNIIPIVIPKTIVKIFIHTSQTTFVLINSS